MRRLPTITATCLFVLLAFFSPLQPVMAATKKKSTKKSSATAKKAPTKSKKASTTSKKAPTTAKKEPVTSIQKKTTPPAESKDATTATAGEKPGSLASLDLPLPAKVSAAGETGTAAEKKTAENPAPSARLEKSDADSATKREYAPNATVEPDTIAEFSAQSPRVQQFLRDAIDLTRLNLTYTFGSADPDNGGMDCSGAIYYLLRAHGYNDLARDSRGQYLWARKGGAFFPVVSKSADSPEFSDLQPGDLMFWTGTYDSQRDVPISHVMIYLGREKGSGKRIMFGASDGRSYNGVRRWGVSVFDFTMPQTDPENPEKARIDFVGYARIPGLRSAGTPPPEPKPEVLEKKVSPKPQSKPKSTSSRKKKGTSKKSR